MKRKDYKDFVWYELTDSEYWVEDFPEEFPGCETIVVNRYDDTGLMLRSTCHLGWGTMAKEGTYKFMIIKK